MNVGVSDAINGINKLGDEELTLLINKNNKRLLESLNNANHQELLVLYHTEVEKYYDELNKYRKNAHDRDSNSNRKVLDNFKTIKGEIMYIYINITKIRRMINTSKDEMIFDKIKVIETLITNSIFLIERRNNMPTEDYISDIDSSLLEIEELKTELLPNIKFLILILRTKDTGNLPLYIQPPKDNLPPQPTNTGSRLQMLSAKVSAQPPQPQAHIVPAVVRRDRGRYRKGQEAAEAGISPRPRQSAKAAAGLRPASGTPRNRGIVPSYTPLSPPPYSQRPPTLYRRTSAAAAASNKLPPTIIAQPQYRRIILGEDTINGDYERGVYPSHLLPKNVVAVDKLKISPPVLSARRGSHSFKSNSPYNDEKPEFDIEGDVRNPPEVYLIDNKNDGLCFLNAIFDYLLYSGKLSIMYERLLAIEELILGQEKYKNDISYIQQIRNVAFINIGFKGRYDILEQLLIPTAIEKNSELMEKKEQGQLIRLEGTNMLKFTDNKDKIKHLGHPFGNDTKPYYENQRLIFAKSMKYIVALYILSYGKSKFTDIITGAIKNTLFVEVAEGSTDPYRNEWNQKLLNYFHDRYEIVYDTKGIPEIHRKTDGAVATQEDIAELVYQYVLEYMKDNYFFANQTLITMFKKVLFKKIKDAKGKNIPRFWLEIATARTEYQDLRATNIFDRVLNKYRFKTLPDGKYIHTDNYDNYISLLCDNNRTHYLLFLLKKEIKYDVFGLSRGGGKPKRPKTVSKSKSPSKPKSVAKPKRPKTAK